MKGSRRRQISATRPGAELGAVDITAWWAAMTMGIPAVVVGYRIGSTAAGGFGLTPGQMLLVIPLGVVATVGLLWLAARPVAAYTEGTLVLLRPSLGFLGAWIYLPVHLVFIVVLAALELRLVGVAIAGGLERFDVVVPVWLPVIVAGAITIGVLLLGLQTARTLLRVVGFWGGLAVGLWALWQFASSANLADVSAASPSPYAWRAVDLIMGLAALYFPFIADSGRLVRDDRSVAPGVGSGFGVAALVALLAGGLAGVAMTGSLNPESAVLALAGGGTVAGGLLLVAWALAGEADQPALMLLPGTEATADLFRDLRPEILRVGVPLIATALAVAVGGEELFGVVSSIMTLLVPLLGVFLADALLIHRDGYLSDGLYNRRGAYRGFNIPAIPALLVGFVMYQWSSPYGGDWWVSFVNTWPGAPSGLPPVFTSLVASFAVYGLLARFFRRQEVYISKVRV